MKETVKTACIKLNSKIYVAGHRGLVGSAIIRNLESKGYKNIVTRTRQELDLMHTEAVNQFYKQEKPEVVIDAAAKVGGIHANNTYPAEFIYDNLTIQNNLINGAYQADVKKFVFLGSSCIYPKMAPQPLKEEYLLTGALEPTNEWYAIAKITGIKMCQAHRTQYDRMALNMRKSLPGASFIGFTPVDNPRFVIAVVFDEPRPYYYGGLVCGPVFKGIAERILRYTKVPEDIEL